MTELIDLSKNLTPQFFENKDFKKGKVLIFQLEDDKTYLKIVRLNRAKRICIAKEVRLYTKEEINEMPKEQAEELIKNG